MTKPPRVIAGRWAITTSNPLPFDHAAIERAFRSARPAIAECLRNRKLPMMSVQLRLTWSSDGTLAIHILHEDRELAESAAPALHAAEWPALRDTALDVTIATRNWDDVDDVERR